MMVVILAVGEEGRSEEEENKDSGVEGKPDEEDKHENNDEDIEGEKGGEDPDISEI